jgi:hypothetical protein
MKTAVKGIGIASALAAVMAGNAYAFPTFNNTEVCGGSNFYTCATLTTSYDHTTSTLTIDIENTGELGGSFRQVAVGNLPEGVTVVSGTEDHPSDAWVISTDINDLNGAGDGGFVYQGYESQGNPGDTFINADGTVYRFTLTFSRDLTDEEVAALWFGTHVQAGPDACGGSSKLWINAGGEGNGPDGGAYAAGCGPSTVVPEPLTMTLLATGLAGMGGAGMLRRRRKA